MKQQALERPLTKTVSRAALNSSVHSPHFLCIPHLSALSLCKERHRYGVEPRSSERLLCDQVLVESDDALISKGPKK